MAYTLQLLRSLIDTHPDRAARLLPHVEALELSIQSQPAFCLQNVRTLFEAAHETIAPRLNLEFRRRDGFPDRMRQVIEAMDFSIADHPDAEQINEHLTALLKGIDDTTVALSRLSNVRNLRHGGSLDWGTLERRHAYMLGGLCDSLVAFLFDVAWSRAEPMAEEIETYEDHPGWNDVLDDDFGSIRIGEGEFWASQILYTLDQTQYDALRRDWLAEADEPAAT